MGSPTQDRGSPWRLPGAWKPFANRWGHDPDSLPQHRGFHIKTEVPKHVDSELQSRNLSQNSQSQKPTAGLKPLDPTAPSYQPPVYSTSQLLRQAESVKPSAAETRVVDPPTRRRYALRSHAAGPQEISLATSRYQAVIEGANSSFISTEASLGGPSGQAVIGPDYIPVQFRNSGPPKVSPVLPPVASESYLAQASLEPGLSEFPQPLLVILDLNGTLIFRFRRGFPVSFIPRPGLNVFLKHLFDNYNVMIWTSSQPQTAREILNRILSRKQRRNLVAIWARDTLDLTRQQYREKTQVYKRLDKVWNSKEIQASYPAATQPNRGVGKMGEADNGSQEPKRNWDQTNTILIDDSQLKGIAQPHNIIVIPEFTNDSTVDELGNLSRVMRQLQLLSRQQDVSRKLREWKEVEEMEFKSEADRQLHVDLEFRDSWDSEFERDAQMTSTLFPSSTFSTPAGDDKRDSDIDRSIAEAQASRDKGPNTAKMPKVSKKRRKREARRGAAGSAAPP